MLFIIGSSALVLVELGPMARQERQEAEAEKLKRDGFWSRATSLSLSERPALARQQKESSGLPEATYQSQAGVTRLRLAVET